MNLTTIWSIPAISFSERLRRTRDCAALFVAHHLPVRIRYWTALSEIGWATRESKNVPATMCCEIIEHLRRPKDMD